MKKYVIEVSAELDNIIRTSAAEMKTSAEKLIVSILSRYTINPHILESEDVKKAYAECGDVNLDWANL